MYLTSYNSDPEVDRCFKTIFKIMVESKNLSFEDFKV